MKILHTSDWHLGASLHNHNRLKEQELFLKWLLKVAADEDIGCILVSGDIFDSSNPPYEALALFSSFVRDLTAAGRTRVIFTGGNHDSARFLDSMSPLVNCLSGSLHGSPQSLMPEAPPEGGIIRLEDAAGQAAALVCAVPFLRAQDVRGKDWEMGEDAAERMLAEGEAVRKYFKETARRAADFRASLGQPLPVICMAHLYVGGSKLSDSETTLTVGNLGAMPADIFSRGFDYVALGHLHTAQNVNGCPNVRYSGSPLPLSFAEASGVKEVTVLEADGTAISGIRSIEVPQFRRLCALKGSLDELHDQLASLAETSCQGEFNAWCDVEYTGEVIIPDLAGELTAWAAQHTRPDCPCPEILVLRHIVAGQVDSTFDEQNVQSLNELTEEGVFEICLKRSNVADTQRDELMELFREVLSEVRSADSGTVSGGDGGDLADMPLSDGTGVRMQTGVELSSGGRV